MWNCSSLKELKLFIVNPNSTLNCSAQWFLAKKAILCVMSKWKVSTIIFEFLMCRPIHNVGFSMAYVSSQKILIWYIYIYIFHVVLKPNIPRILGQNLDCWCHYSWRCPIHYSGVIMSVMASQFTILPNVYSTVYSGADQRKHQSSAPLAFVKGNSPVNGYSHTKGQWREKCLYLMTSLYHVQPWYKQCRTHMLSFSLWKELYYHHLCHPWAEKL